MQEHLASCEWQMARLGLTLDGRHKSEVKDTRAARPSPYVLASYDREKLYKRGLGPRRRSPNVTASRMWPSRRRVASCRSRNLLACIGRRRQPGNRCHGGRNCCPSNLRRQREEATT